MKTGIKRLRLKAKKTQVKIDFMVYRGLYIIRVKKYLKHQFSPSVDHFAT